MGENDRVVQSLEPRRLLSAVGGVSVEAGLKTVDAPAVIEVDWMGRQTPVFAGRFVVQTDVTRGRVVDQVSELRSRLSGSGVEVARHLGAAGLFLVRAPVDWTSEQVRQAVDRVAKVLYVEPDLVGQLASVIPNDASFNQQWGLRNTGQFGGVAGVDINATNAWRLSTGLSGESVIVAVIDSGMDYNHPDLSGVRFVNTGESLNGIDSDGNGYVDDIGGYDFFGNGGPNDDPDNDPMDQNGHGTHVSGTVAARVDNSIGVAGVSWGAKVLPLKIGASGNFVSVAAAVEAHYYAIGMKQRGFNIRVINNSWGTYSPSFPLALAVQAAHNNGILVVSAAGNDATTSLLYPAAYSLSMAVGNITRTGSIASTSNFGSSWVQLGAPGTSILSTVPGNLYQNFSGTSMASPHVAGVAALAFALKPDATPAQVRQAILDSVTVVPSYSNFFSTAGRLDGFGTLQRIALLDAPAAPTLSAASDTGVRSSDHVTNAQTLNLTGTAPWGSTLRLLVDGQPSASVVIGNSLTYSLNLSGLGEGLREVRARFEYAAGVSPLSAPLMITIDRTPPTLAFSAPPSAVSQTPPGQIGLSFSEEVFGLGLSNFTMTRNGQPISLAGSTLQSFGNGQYTLGNLASSVSLPGVYQLHFDGLGVTDAAGNVTPPTSTDPFRVYKLGDMNGDGQVNAADIAPFVLALTDLASFSSQHPWTDAVLSGDVNGDGALTAADIASFVSMLLGGGGSALTSGGSGQSGRWAPPPNRDPLIRPASASSSGGVISLVEVKTDPVPLEPRRFSAVPVQAR